MADLRLRSDNPLFFLLETVPTHDDKIILGSRLPTNNQVLLCFLSYHIHDNLNIHDAANATVKIVQPFYGKARIPMLAPQKMAEEVKKLHTEMPPQESFHPIKIKSRLSNTNSIRL